MDAKDRISPGDASTRVRSDEGSADRSISLHNVPLSTPGRKNGADLLSVPCAHSGENSTDLTGDNGESNSTGTYVASPQGETLKGDM